LLKIFSLVIINHSAVSLSPPALSLALFI